MKDKNDEIRQKEVYILMHKARESLVRNLLSMFYIFATCLCKTTGHSSFLLKLPTIRFLVIPVTFY